MAISESTRLLAPGVDITLSDGKVYPLRFDFEAMHYIEDEFGDLEEVPKVLNASGWKQRRIHKISAIFVAALIHTGMTPEQIVHLLCFKDIIRYLEALTEAFNQSMPEGEPVDPKGRGSRAGSRGNGSMRTPRRGTGGRTALSGA